MEETQERVVDRLEMVTDNALVFLKQGKPLEAASILRPARWAVPGSDTVRELLSLSLLRSKQDKEARRELALLVAKDPTNHWAHHALAVALRRLSRYEEAVAHARLALAMRPNSNHYRMLVDRSVRIRTLSRFRTD